MGLMTERIDTAISEFFDKVDRRGRRAGRLHRAMDKGAEYLRPKINEWMGIMRRKILSDLTHKFAKFTNLTNFAKDTALEITTKLTDWEWIQDNGRRILKPALLTVLGKGADEAFIIGGIEARFDVLNPRSVAWAEKHCAKLVREVTDETRVAIRDVIRRGVKEGKSVPHMAKEIRPLVGLTSRQSMAVANYDEWLIMNRPELSASEVSRRVDVYARRMHRRRANMISHTESAFAVDEGTLQGYEEAEVEKVEILLAVGACDDCVTLARKRYKPSEAHGILPAHPVCYDDKTEVYTDEGWKFFKDLNNKEQILSLNPVTFQLEWLPYVQKIEYHYKGKLFYLHNKWFSLVATPDHSQLFGRRIDPNDRKKVRWEIKTLEEIVGYKEFMLPRTARWIGISPQFLDINGLKLETKLFCRFMGYWLSEGSVTQRAKEKGWNWYQISIAQKLKGLNKIYEDIKLLPVKLAKGKNHITCNDKRLGKYLLQFGHSDQKFIPQEIKQLSPEFIKEFLFAFNFGDGSTRNTKWHSKEKDFESREYTFSTSSPKLAGDLGELILKAGGYPSYRIKNNAGKEVKFKNGVYKIKWDQYIISWNHSKNAYFGDKRKRWLIDSIDYDGMVYDVELPRNHILWVKHNGKTCFSGNCRCCWSSL